MVTDAELSNLLAKLPGERVTYGYMQSRILSTKFIHLPLTTTVCHLTLDNGFSIIGESACVSPENYDQTIGEKVAYDAAIEKLWFLFGFLLAEKLYLRRNAVSITTNAPPSLT